METKSESVPVSRGAIWTGRTLSLLVVALMVFSGIMKILKPAPVVQGFIHMGYAESISLPLGIVEAACAILYLFPPTSILGAILLTGYLGGATASTVRIGDAFIAPVIVGIVVWAGLFLREPRLRALIPLRTARGAPSCRLGPEEADKHAEPGDSKTSAAHV